MAGKRWSRGVNISILHCMECGEKFPIPRNRQQREKKHIKDLWCPYCKKTQKFTEQRSIDHILTECIYFDDIKDQIIEYEPYLGEDEKLTHENIKDKTEVYVTCEEARELIRLWVSSKTEIFVAYKSFLDVICNPLDMENCYTWEEWERLRFERKDEEEDDDEEELEVTIKTIAEVRNKYPLVYGKKEHGSKGLRFFSVIILFLFLKFSFISAYSIGKSFCFEKDSLSQ